MNNIVVSVSELLNLAEELKADGMEFVELSVTDPLEDDGELVPSTLWASGFKSSLPDLRKDYDELEIITDFD